jgi:hypothetical protein
VGFEHILKVWMGSSCCSVGMHHGLVVDASFDWKPECTEEQDDMRELRHVDFGRLLRSG